jgi:endonuclease III
MMQWEQLQPIYDRLAATFGVPVLEPDEDPLGELVETILSQSTSDVNSHRAYQDLRSAFSTWEMVRDAPTEHVAETIRHGGLANVKAPRIQEALREITRMLSDDNSGEPLDKRFSRWLIALPVEEARQALQKIPGVGPKTAACVLLFSLGLPSMPVDTHVYRVTQRLGLVPTRMNVARVHELYDAVTPADLIYPLHILFITLGRRICQSQRPRCSQCPLLDLCPTGRQLVYTDAD